MSTVIRLKEPILPFDTTAIAGPRRFQWNAGGWFGSSLGSTCWMAPTAGVLAYHDHATLAYSVVAIFVTFNLISLLLWMFRHRVTPFSALMVLLAMLAVSIPGTLYMIGENATDAALTALNWPLTSFVPLIAFTMIVATIGWFCFLEFSHNDGSRIASPDDAQADG